MSPVTIDTHPIMAKLKLASQITLESYLKESDRTEESLSEQYLEWRIAIDYPKYSFLSEPIDEFVERLVLEENQNGTRVIPNGHFVIYIEGKTYPGSFWSTTINRNVFDGLDDPRLVIDK
jgi:hypothetical protein